MIAWAGGRGNGRPVIWRFRGGVIRGMPSIVVIDNQLRVEYCLWFIHLEKEEEDGRELMEIS